LFHNRLPFAFSVNTSYISQNSNTSRILITIARLTLVRRALALPQEHDLFSLALNSASFVQNAAPAERREFMHGLIAFRTAEHCAFHHKCRYNAGRLSQGSYSSALLCGIGTWVAFDTLSLSALPLDPWRLGNSIGFHRKSGVLHLRLRRLRKSDGANGLTVSIPNHDRLTKGLTR
jgi:hypothetical protein